jgi:hypothetical protein
MAKPRTKEQLIAARKEAIEALKTPNVLDALLLDPSKDAVAELAAALQARATLHVLADPHGIDWRGVSEDGRLANGRAVDEVIAEQARKLAHEVSMRVGELCHVPASSKPRADTVSQPGITVGETRMFVYTASTNNSFRFGG